MKAKFTSGGTCFQRGGRAKGWIDWVVLSSMSVCSLPDSASRSQIWPKYSPPTTHRSKPVHFPERSYFQIVTSVCLQPAWVGSLLQLPLLLSRGEQGKLQQNRTILLSAPFSEFRLFPGVSLGPSSTWLTHLVSYWPLLPWLIGDTSITSHRD